MQLPVTNGECPWCYKKIQSYNSNEYKYGSPIVYCKGCGKKYIDRRYHELACEGIPQSELNTKRYKNMALLGLAFTVGLVLFCLFTHYTRGTVMIEFLLMIPISALVVIFNIVELIKVKTGIKQKQLMQYMQQSQERVKDPVYAAELEENGYYISK